MSWYKKAELNIVDMTDSRGDYRDIAHDLYRRTKKVNIDNPNYMWVYVNKEIKVNPETMEQSSHSYVPGWENIDYAKTFAGRYSPSTKTITVIRPTGIFQFKEIPYYLKRLLYQQFPEAQEILIFASRNNWYKIAQVALVFEHIHEDFHNNQNDYILKASDASTIQPVGMVGYSDYKDEIYINNMLVKKDLRRQGIGTQMIEELKKKYGVKIHWGYSTPEGSALYESMDNPTNELG